MEQPLHSAYCALSAQHILRRPPSPRGALFLLLKSNPRGDGFILLGRPSSLESGGEQELSRTDAAVGRQAILCLAPSASAFC